MKLPKTRGLKKPTNPRITSADVPKPGSVVLVPMDFSEPSQRALNYAKLIAARTGAELALLNVSETVYVPDDLGGLQYALLQRQLEQASLKRLKQLATGLTNEGVRARATLRTGNPAEEIAAAARELKAGLIVISTHGYTGLKHALLGSTTEKLLRATKCPVLVVRSED